MGSSNTSVDAFSSQALPEGLSEHPRLFPMESVANPWLD